MRIIAIDPGYERTAFVIYDSARLYLDEFGIIPNDEFLRTCGIWCELSQRLFDVAAIEKVEGFGMAVGKEVFETVWWTGRIHQVLRAIQEPVRIPRRAVKLHLCGNSRAKDPNIRQALLDRFGPGREEAIGTKSRPGPLYGVSKDVWAALAVAVTVAESEDWKDAAA